MTHTTKTFISKLQFQNKPAIETVLTIPSVTIARLAAQSDADFVMIDMEHAPLPMDVVTQMVHAYAQSSHGLKFPLVRVPSHGVEWIKWALDSGAAGIIVPMVNNAREMTEILDRAIYPPAGRRNFGPLYAPFADLSIPNGGMYGYVKRAQKGDIAILPIIESKEGLASVEEILSLDGVAGCFIGPADLRFSLGMGPAVDGPEPEFSGALKQIVDAAKKFGKVVGTMGMGEDQAMKRTAEGMDFLLSTFDYGSVVAGMAQDIAAARRGLQKQ